MKFTAEILLSNPELTRKKLLLIEESFKNNSLNSIERAQLNVLLWLLNFKSGTDFILFITNHFSVSGDFYYEMNTLNIAIADRVNKRIILSRFIPVILLITLFIRTINPLLNKIYKKVYEFKFSQNFRDLEYEFDLTVYTALKKKLNTPGYKILREEKRLYTRVKQNLMDRVVSRNLYHEFENANSLKLNYIWITEEFRLNYFLELLKNAGLIPSIEEAKSVFIIKPGNQTFEYKKLLWFGTHAQLCYLIELLIKSHNISESEYSGIFTKITRVFCKKDGQPFENNLLSNSYNRENKKPQNNYRLKLNSHELSGNYQIINDIVSKASKS